MRGICERAHRDYSTANYEFDKRRWSNLVLTFLLGKFCYTTMWLCGFISRTRQKSIFRGNALSKCGYLLMDTANINFRLNRRDKQCERSKIPLDPLIKFFPNISLSTLLAWSYDSATRFCSSEASKKEHLTNSIIYSMLSSICTRYILNMSTNLTHVLEFSRLIYWYAEVKSV